MQFLHPVFTVIFAFLILYSFVDIKGNRKYSGVVMVVLAVVLILLSGLRNYVGADYPVYKQMYLTYFPELVEYKELFRKMFFLSSSIEIEWIYALVNKAFFEFTQAPFHIFTLLLAVVLISVKFDTIYRNSLAPVLALLLYFVPTFFITDSGHMRQAMGVTILLFSFKFIKERKLLLYLLCVYLAYGFHKSSIIFLPAYWFATVNLNARKIAVLVMICVVLSPLQIYEWFSFFLNSMPLEEVNAGYEGYISYEIAEANALRFMDVLTIFYVLMIVLFDEETSEVVPYYEYMRNIGVLGICIYFIMRENPVFSTRLVGHYYMYMVLIIPNILVSIKNVSWKRFIHIGYVVFLIFYFFVFAKFQGAGGRFTPDTYNNYLWSSW